MTLKTIQLGNMLQPFFAGSLCIQVLPHVGTNRPHMIKTLKISKTSEVFACFPRVQGCPRQNLSMNMSVSQGQQPWIQEQMDVSYHTFVIQSRKQCCDSLVGLHFKQSHSHFHGVKKDHYYCKPTSTGDALNQILRSARIEASEGQAQDQPLRTRQAGGREL